MSLANDYMLNFASYIQQIKEFVCFVTVESNKSKDRESTSTQNDDKQSNSGAHVSGQATAQLDYQSKLKIPLTQFNHILTIILLSMVVLNMYSCAVKNGCGIYDTLNNC